MSITYPPELLPAADDDAEVVLVLPKRLYRNPEALAWARWNWPEVIVVEEQEIPTS